MAKTIGARVRDDFYDRIVDRAKKSGYSPSGYLKFVLEVAEGHTPRFWELAIRELADRYNLGEGTIVELIVTDALARAQANPEYIPDFIVKKNDGSIMKGMELADSLRTKHQVKRAHELQGFFDKK